MTTPLFRPEAIVHRHRRLEGDIILTRSVPLWAMTLLLTGITASSIIWALLGHYHRTQMVPGEVLPSKSLSKVFAYRPGRLLWVGVREGQHVKAGQVIASIQVEQTLDGGRSPSAERLASFASQSDLLKAQLRFEDDREVHERLRLQQLASSLDQERAILADQLAFQKQNVSSTRESFEAVSSLVPKGFITRYAFEQRRQAWLNAAAQLQTTVQQMAQLAERKGEVLSELAKLPADHASRIASLEASADDVNQKRIDVEGARGFTITAPITGRVTAVQMTAGRYTDGRLPLLSIVPDDASMEAMLFAPSRAIGMSRPGQTVRLMFDAFPYQQFGSFGGRIVAISRTVLAPDEVDAPMRFQEPVYQMRVKLDRQMVNAFGQSVPLQPGMTLAADIVLDQRSFLDWLLEPIRAVRNRA